MHKKYSSSSALSPAKLHKKTPSSMYQSSMKGSKMNSPMKKKVNDIIAKNIKKDPSYGGNIQDYWINKKAIEDKKHLDYLNN